MSRNLKVLLSFILAIALSQTLSASSLIREVIGHENKGITVNYNNQVQNLKDSNGNQVYPVIINGTSYLPLRAMTTMLGKDVVWDEETSTIYINDKEESDDSSINAGTIEDPIEIGKTYSFNYSFGSESNVDYKITVTKVTPLTGEDLENLGYKRFEENSPLECVRVTMKVDASNATYEGDNFAYLWMYKPDFNGTKTSDGKTLKSYSDYEFDGSLGHKIYSVTKDIKVKPNENKSFTAEGDVIVEVYKNSNNNFAVVVGDEPSDIVYFKLN